MPVIYWLKNQVEPSDPEIRLTSPETKALWFCKVEFLIQEDVLHYEWLNTDKIICALVPTSLR